MDGGTSQHRAVEGSDASPKQDKRPRRPSLSVSTSDSALEVPSLSSSPVGPSRQSPHSRPWTAAPMKRMSGDKLTPVSAGSGNSASPSCDSPHGVIFVENVDGDSEAIDEGTRRAEHMGNSRLGLRRNSASQLDAQLPKPFHSPTPSPRISPSPSPGRERPGEFALSGVVNDKLGTTLELPSPTPSRRSSVQSNLSDDSFHSFHTPLSKGTAHSDTLSGSGENLLHDLVAHDGGGVGGGGILVRNPGLQCYIPPNTFAMSNQQSPHPRFGQNRSRSLPLTPNPPSSPFTRLPTEGVGRSHNSGNVAPAVTPSSNSIKARLQATATTPGTGGVGAVDPSRFQQHQPLSASASTSTSTHPQLAQACPTQPVSAPPMYPNHSPLKKLADIRNAVIARRLPSSAHPSPPTMSPPPGPGRGALAVTPPAPPRFQPPHPSSVPVPPSPSLSSSTRSRSPQTQPTETHAFPSPVGASAHPYSSSTSPPLPPSPHPSSTPSSAAPKPSLLVRSQSITPPKQHPLNIVVPIEHPRRATLRRSESGGGLVSPLTPPYLGTASDSTNTNSAPNTPASLQRSPHMMHRAPSTESVAGSDSHSLSSAPRVGGVARGSQGSLTPMPPGSDDEAPGGVKRMGSDASLDGSQTSTLLSRAARRARSIQPRLTKRLLEELNEASEEVDTLHGRVTSGSLSLLDRFARSTGTVSSDDDDNDRGGGGDDDGDGEEQEQQEQGSRSASASGDYESAESDDRDISVSTPARFSAPKMTVSPTAGVESLPQASPLITTFRTQSPLRSPSSDQLLSVPSPSSARSHRRRERRRRRTVADGSRESPSRKRVVPEEDLSPSVIKHISPLSYSRKPRPLEIVKQMGAGAVPGGSDSPRSKPALKRGGSGSSHVTVSSAFSNLSGVSGFSSISSRVRPASLQRSPSGGSIAGSVVSGLTKSVSNASSMDFYRGEAMLGEGSSVVDTIGEESGEEDEAKVRTSEVLRQAAKAAAESNASQSFPLVKAVSGSTDTDVSTLRRGLSTASSRTSSVLQRTSSSTTTGGSVHRQDPSLSNEREEESSDCGGGEELQVVHRPSPLKTVTEFASWDDRSMSMDGMSVSHSQSLSHEIEENPGPISGDGMSPAQKILRSARRSSTSLSSTAEFDSETSPGSPTGKPSLHDLRREDKGSGRSLVKEVLFFNVTFVIAIILVGVAIIPATYSRVHWDQLPVDKGTSIDVPRMMRLAKQMEWKFFGVASFTDDELMEFDGSDRSKPLLTAIKGEVYDVTSGWHIYGPGQVYAAFAGGEILAEREEMIEGWRTFFRDVGHYHLVGKVVDDDDDFDRDDDNRTAILKSMSDAATDIFR